MRLILIEQVTYNVWVLLDCHTFKLGTVHRTNPAERTFCSWITVPLIIKVAFFLLQFEKLNIMFLYWFTCNDLFPHFDYCSTHTLIYSLYIYFLTNSKETCSLWSPTNYVPHLNQGLCSPFLCWWNVKYTRDTVNTNYPWSQIHSSHWGNNLKQHGKLLIM